MPPWPNPNTLIAFLRERTIDWREMKTNLMHGNLVMNEFIVEAVAECEISWRRPRGSSEGNSTLTINLLPFTNCSSCKKGNISIQSELIKQQHVFISSDRSSVMMCYHSNFSELFLSLLIQFFLLLVSFCQSVPTDFLR